MKRSNKYTISRLFRNDRFLIIFAFVASCILWFIFSQNSGEDTVTIINDIPINVELSQTAINNGLEVFSKGAETASVKISGNKITVGSIKKEDILVTATQTGTINSSNTYPLQLTAKQNSSKTNYSIVSVEPTFVNVYVDKRRSKEFDIKDNIKYDFKVDKTYYAGNTTYSTRKIEVNGPELEVSKISSVAIEGEIKGELKSTAEIEANVILYNVYGEAVNDENLSVSAKKVTVSIPVFPKAEVPIKAKFSNVPQIIDPDKLVHIEPSSILIAAPEATLGTLNEIALPVIDFSTVDPRNKNSTEFKFDINLPSDCKNISGVTKAEVKINLSDVKTKEVKLTDFTLENVDPNSLAIVTTTDIVVTIAGQQDTLSSLKADNITATIDLKSKGADFVGFTEIPVKIKIDDGKYCWVVGKYSVNVNVEKKT